MTSTLRKLLSNKFVQNVGLLASGTVAGQIVMIAALPVLTRYFEPGAFGVLGMYMSVLMILSVAACLRFDIAIPIPAEESEAVSLLVLSLLAATVFSLLIALLIYLLPDDSLRRVNPDLDENVSWLVPLGVWFGATYSAIQFWAIRKNRYKAVANTQFTRALSGSGVQLGFAFSNPVNVGLLLGHLVYTGIGSLSLATRAFVRDKAILSTVSVAGLVQAIRRNKRFPIYSVPESLLNNAAVNLPLPLIAVLAGAEEAGYMLLAQRVSSVPVGLLGGSISRVFLAEATEKRKVGQLGEFTRGLMFALFKIALVPFILLALLAPTVFPVLFGDNWLRAGVMVAWLVPYTFLQFIVSPVSTILHATANQAVAFRLQLFGFALLIGAILLANGVMPSYIFELFAVSAAFYYATYSYVVLRLARRETQG